jgi:starch-binding outer membrane protein, SusD/RagB family
MNKLFILSIAALPFFFSCRKDLNGDPLNTISDKEAFSTPERIDKSAVGMYDALQNANYFGGRILVYADIRGIDATTSVNTYGNMVLFNTLQAGDPTTGDAWKGAYRTIYEANLFLKNFAPNASLVTAEKANQYIGEAKFIRALCYFYLVNMWAHPYALTANAAHKGVPLVLEAATDPFAVSNQIARSSVKDVYAAIEADLLDAESKLPVAYANAYISVSRATKGAARALLMRLNLYKRDYAKANTYANLLITSGLYVMNTSPITAFRDYTTKESIFSVAHDGGDNPNTNYSIGNHYSAAKAALVPATLDYVQLFESFDKRMASNGADSLIELRSGAYWTRKYNAGTTDWIPVFRYPEVLLTSAEALANLAAGATADPDAIILLNQVRARSSATPLAPGNKTDLLNAIYLERRRELAFEGQGSLDFLRTGRAIPAHGTVAEQPYGSNYTILPIPKYDTDKNLNLAQNDGY